jgi:AcrR family transcriptional regulator
MANRDEAARILDAALDRADAVGWSNLRLFDVADALKLGLDRVREHFRDTDALGNAWLARAEAAMLASRALPGFAAKPAKESLLNALLAFYRSLAEHKRASLGVVRAKLYFGHPHHNIEFVLWVSRTVQWLREAAGLRNDVGGARLGDVRRRIEEIGLTALFLAGLWHMARDDSPTLGHTRAFLERRLDEADALMAKIFPLDAKPAKRTSVRRAIRREHRR